MLWDCPGDLSWWLGLAPELWRLTELIRFGMCVEGELIGCIDRWPGFVQGQN